MKVKVWDSYVKKTNGYVAHFDIIVPEDVIDSELIYRFGKQYLDSIGERNAKLDSAECQYCHIEEPTEEMQLAIQDKGYFILEMEEIPARLDENPSRRDLIMHLKAHSKAHRFTNFKGVRKEDVESLIQNMK